MAYIESTNIITAIRDVLHNNHGSAQTIASGEYRPGYYDALTDNAKGLKSLSVPSVDVRIKKVKTSKMTPVQFGNKALYELTLSILVSRAFTTEHKSTTITRDLLDSLAAKDSSVLSQALSYPGNLTQTASAAPTGLVSGLIRFDGIVVPQIKNKTIITDSTFSRIALVTL